MPQAGYIERAAKISARSIQSDHFLERVLNPKSPCRRARGAMRNTPGLTFRGSPLAMKRLFAASARWRCCLVFAVFIPVCSAQVGSSSGLIESATAQDQLAVNWLYGAYIPKDAPIVALDGNERYRLFIRQSFTTPGIYVLRPAFLRSMIRSGTHLLSGRMGLKVLPSESAHDRHNFYCRTHSHR
jgi:hypothetical protein